MKATVLAEPIGRDLELELVRKAIGDAATGRGSLVIACGAAGIGKTRFLEAIGTTGVRLGFVAALSTNYASVRAPFGPFADLVEILSRKCPNIVPSDPAERVLFERYFGQVTVQSESTADRRRLFVVLASALIRASTSTPLCIAIDDAQWADPETIEFLQFWATRMINSRVVTVVGLRDDDDGSQNECAVALARFERVQTIALRPLDHRASHELIAFSATPGRALSGRTIDEICRLAEGNPLFITELVRVATSTEGAVALPKSAELATRKRVRSLAERHARILEVASALGRSFSFDDLTVVAGRTRAEVLDALRACRDATLIAEDPSSVGRFEFAHELVRTVVYSSMFAAERSEIHRRIAQTLEAREAPAEILAHHFRLCGDTNASATYAERAAEIAHSLGAYGSARDRYLDLLDCGVGDSKRAEICVKLASAYTALGDSASARARLVESMSIYREAGNDTLVAQLECTYADVAYRCGNVDDAIAAARSVLSRRAPPETRFTAHVLLATFYAYRPDIPRALEEISQADACTNGRTLKDELRLAWAKASVAIEDSSSEAWREPAEASLGMSQTYGDPQILAYTSMNFATMARERGRDDLARPVLQEAIAIADINGLALASAYARIETVDDLYSQGRLLEAQATIREVIALQVDAPVAAIMLAAYAMPALADIGTLHQFPMFADPQIIEIARTMGEQSRYALVTAAFAYVDAMAGNIDRARAYVARVLPELSSTNYIASALLVFARIGTSEDIAVVHRLFESERTHRSRRVYRWLVEALFARDTGDEVRASAALQSALGAAEIGGFGLLQAYCFELKGRTKDAIASYERYGAISHVQRLTVKSGALTKREREVAELMRSGLSNRAISEKLVLSERTVENHVAAIYQKSGVKNRSEFSRTFRSDS